MLEYMVFDGQLTLTKSDYEKQIGLNNVEKSNTASPSNNEQLQGDDALVEVIYREQDMEYTTVYIGGS